MAAKRQQRRFAGSRRTTGDQPRSRRRRVKGRGVSRPVARSKAAAQAASKAEPQDRPSWRSRRQTGELTAPTAGLLPRGTETVLVVDDPLAPRGALANVLRQLGYQVLEAPDAVEARRLVETQGRIHLLLLDLSTPEPSDLQLALWFRAIYPETKVLVTSGSLWELNFQLGVSQQVALLAKPFTTLELAQMVRRVLE